MTVSWNTTSGATGGYQYRWSTDPICLLAGVGCTDDNYQNWTNYGSGSGNTTITFPDSANSVPALFYGHTYYFEVRGRTTGTTGDASPTSDGAFHRMPVPGKLAGLTATPDTQRVKLDWDDPDAAWNVLNYDYRVDDGNGWSLEQNFTTDTTEYAVTGLTNGNEYSFQVRARNSHGQGEWSEIVSATPSGPPAAPADPDGQARRRKGGPGLA